MRTKCSYFFFISVFLIILNCSYAIQINGLVAEYLFNGNANDTSVNGYNGSVHGATLATDRFGNANSAYNFDDIDDYISAANVTNLQMTNSFTLSVWIYKRDTDQDRIVGVFESAGNVQPEYGMLNSSQKIRIQVKDNTNSWETALDTNSNTTMSINEWHHLLFTFNGSTYQFYLNGFLDGSGTWDNSVRNNDSSPYLYIGTRGDLFNQEYFDGLIDDIRIYNRALSVSEIHQLAEVPEPITLVLLISGFVALLTIKK